MTTHMPQEVEVWYMLPALRKELTSMFTSEHGMSQKEVSKVLGVTESAVSQYLKSKRANELVFSLEDKIKIKDFAEKIVKDRENAMKHFFDLTMAFRGSKTMCDFHRKMDSSLPKECDVCNCK